MEYDSFDVVAAKHGLTPERLVKVSRELYGLLSCYEPKEILAVAEVIENGINPSRIRDKGAEK